MTLFAGRGPDLQSSALAPDLREICDGDAGLRQPNSRSRGPLIGGPIPIKGARAAQQPWRVKTITSRDEFLSLESDWKGLEERSPEATIFQRFGWCKAWVEATQAVGLPETLRIVTIRSGVRLVAVWPLALRTLYGARLAHWLGEPATQYGDVLMEPSEHRPAWFAAAWNEIKSWRDIDGVQLRRVRDDSALCAFPEVSGDANIVASAAAPFVDFENSPTSLNESLGRRGRTHCSLRRHLRRLEAVGAVDFELIESTEAQRQAVSEALALKQIWLAAKGLASAGHHHPANEGFLRALAMRGEFVVARMTVGGESAAFEIGMTRRDKRYYSMLQSYDLRFAAHGPGQLLLWHVLRRNKEIGISLFDFLAPVQRHKREWASGEIGVNDYFVPRSPLGTVAKFGFSHLKPALRWAFDRLPGDARRLFGQRISVQGLGQ